MNGNTNFRGIFAALVTPYTAEGKIDLIQLKRLVRMLIGQGIDGFYVTGSTAEVFLMDEAERFAVLDAVLEENNGEKAVLSHVGAISTDQAVRYAAYAQRAGADAVSAISPFYYHFSDEEIISYYRAIMEETALPMFVYNFPAFSGFSLSEEILARLKGCKNLRGVKFTSSDMFLLERIKTNNPELVVLNGYDEMLTAGLAMGADGGVGSTYNCMAPLIRRIYDCAAAGRFEEARACQQRANAIISCMCRHGVFASVKALLELQGLSFGGCRRPFAPLTDDARQELFAVYRRYMEQE